MILMTNHYQEEYLVEEDVEAGFYKTIGMLKDIKIIEVLNQFMSSKNSSYN